MTFSEMFPSNYLTQDDFPQPRTLTIAGVTIEELRRPGGAKAKKPVLYFQDKDVKPMVLNKTNGVVLAKLYGRNPDGWKGKAIEVFAEPDVKMAGETVGGIRMRKPTVPSAANGVKSPSTPLPKPATQTPLTDLEAHTKILAAFENVRTAQRLEEWATWGKNNFTFTPVQEDEQSDAYHAAMQRLGLLEPVGASKDIPF